MSLIKKVALGLGLSMVFAFAQAHELNAQIQQKLTGNGKVYDFSFRDSFHPSTLKAVLESETAIKIEISKEAQQHQVPSFIVKKITYLEFLKQGADRLNLKAVQLDQSRIMLVPK